MRFAIVASPRTGSSHLTNLLNLRVDVLCNGEILHPKRVFVNWRKKHRTPEKLAELFQLRATSPDQFLERIFAMDYDRPNVGFKILRGQQKHVFERIIEDHSIKKIILFRRNVLANYSSRLIAGETGQYALRAKKAAQQTGERLLVPFDANEFMMFRRKYESYYASVMDALLESDQNFHLINYEEINTPHFFKSLLRYIGASLTGEASEGKHIKQNSSNIVSRFSNPEEVETFLQEHDLPHWRFEGEILFDVPQERSRKRRPDRGHKRRSSEPAGALANRQSPDIT
jgi:hypothetical protein